MTFLLCSLAAYKVLQVADALTPKEAMPWVKVVFGVVVGYGAAFSLHLYNPWISGLAIATASGIVHSVLRLLTYVGDAAHRRSLK
jgi:hypothetical protein